MNMTISHAAWGYVTRLTDFSGGRIMRAGGTSPDGRHTFAKGFDSGTLLPGVLDSVLQQRTGYGYVRPRDEQGPDVELWEAWARCRMPRLDYYVAQKHGSPDPAAVPFLYPDRLFVNGEDAEGNELSRSELLRHLEAVGIPHRPDYWWPVQIYTGLKAGYPVFRAGLRADTDMDIGPTWYHVRGRLSTSLPEGYQWDTASGSYGCLYKNDESPASASVSHD